MTTPYRMYWAKGSPESGQLWDALKDRGNFCFIPGVHPADFSAYQLVMPHLQITGVGHARDAAGVSQGTFVSVYPGTDDEVFKVRQQDRDGVIFGPLTTLTQLPRLHKVAGTIDSLPQSMETPAACCVSMSIDGRENELFWEPSSAGE